MTEDVRFGDCRGWLYRPAGADGPLPVVILAHGLGAPHTVHYWRAAEAFAAAGYAALDFDPRRLGESAGEPRQALSLAGATDDLRAAVAYARSRDDLGPIVLYGSSIGGAMAIAVAAEDADIAALLLIVPMVDGLTNFPGLTLRERRWLLGAAVRDKASGMAGRGRRPVKLFGDAGEPAILNRDGALAAVTAETLPGATFRNELAPWDLLPMGFARPIRVMGRVRCPVLVVVGERDTVTPPGPQRKAAAAAGAEVLSLDCGHFGPFVAPHFDTVRERALAFLRRHVGAPIAARN